MTTSTLLVDRFGRRIHKLRVSLLDACNFRCSYCMPSEPKFMARQNILSLDELETIVSSLVSLGIDEIRLTGGEPTLRSDLVQVARAMSGLGLRKLGLTSNGFLLERYLSGLRLTECQHLNISIDSLNRETFHRIAKRDGYHDTLGAILSAKNLGFQVKVNVVVMRGINDHEINDFVDFAERNRIDVRFLELMAIGVAAPEQSKLFVSAAEILDKIRRFRDLQPIEVEPDSTSRVFRTSGGGRIGTIAPVSQSFCGTCSRWRLGPDGKLKACIMATDGLDLRGLAHEDIQRRCEQALLMKPAVGASQTPVFMHAIGG
jgi:cyclic pyranopterin phosphate synthase